MDILQSIADFFTSEAFMGEVLTFILGLLLSFLPFVNDNLSKFFSRKRGKFVFELLQVLKDGKLEKSEVYKLASMVYSLKRSKF